MLVKLLLMDDLIASIAVKIPTNAIIPKAIIKTVRIVRNNWLRIAPNDMLMFSLINEAIKITCRSTKITKFQCLILAGTLLNPIAIGKEGRTVKVNNFFGGIC